MHPMSQASTHELLWYCECQQVSGEKKKIISTLKMKLHAIFSLWLKVTFLRT